MAEHFTILANPGHGNGPTVALLMAAEAIQRELNQPVNIIFPFTGDAQQAVINRRRDQNLKGSVNVYFDRYLGEQLYKVTLRENKFRQNVADIIALQNTVEESAHKYINRGLTVQNETGESKPLKAGDLKIEINHGSRIRIIDDIKQAFYFFPCLLSDLLMRSDEIPQEKRDDALSIIKRLEEGYALVFLPIIHTFSWDTSWQPPSHVNVYWTPFPRPDPRQYVSRNIVQK